MRDVVRRLSSVVLLMTIVDMSAILFVSTPSGVLPARRLGGDRGATFRVLGGDQETESPFQAATSPKMLPRQILLALHLDQPTRGTLEFESQPLTLV